LPTLYEVIDFILRLGIVVSISIFAAQIIRESMSKKKESNERLRRVCNTLCIEVNNLDNWYKSEEYEALKTRHYSQNIINTAPYEGIQYSQNIINITPYEGIVNSGLITHLEEETQKKLNEYYFIATLHNKRMYDLAQIFNNKASSSGFITLEDEQKITSSLAWHLNEIELTKYEKRMQELMPELKLLLHDEIKNAKEKKWFHIHSG
jgi:hypothetical protein